MQRSSRWLIFLCSNALLLAQPTLRLKVHVPANTLVNPGDTIASENPIIRGARLPRLTPIHMIVQFDQPPTADTLDALRARGAVVLQDVPDNAVLVLMNENMALDGALDGLGIRSARRLDPREKISPLITDGDASAASGYYLVEFHPDVDPSDARRLILNSGVELRENPDLLRQHLMVHIPNPSRHTCIAGASGIPGSGLLHFPRLGELGCRCIDSHLRRCTGLTRPYRSTHCDQRRWLGWPRPGRHHADLCFSVRHRAASGRCAAERNCARHGRMVQSGPDHLATWYRPSGQSHRQHLLGDLRTRRRFPVRRAGRRGSPHFLSVPSQC